MKTVRELLKKDVGRKQPVVFAFGRFNPPTIGHQKLIDKVITIAKRVKGLPVLYVSATQDKKKNPLSAKDKLKYIKMVYKRGIQLNAAGSDSRTFMEILKNRFNKKYTEVYMIAGSDRVAEFKRLIKKYNKVDYNFDRVEVISAGERDPDAEGTTGMSASKMREYVMSNNFDEFKKGVMNGMGDKNAMTLFKDLKKKMGVSELNMPSLEDEISNEKQKIRENYFDNKTLLMGDMVENTNNGNVGKIIKRGANYIQYEMEDGGIEKAWLHDVMPAENIQSQLRNEDVNKKKLVLQKNSEQLDEKKDEKRKSTKDDRARHFAKGAKMDDDNPAAYKPAPGDKKGKTRPSVHTKKFKQMYGDSYEIGADYAKHTFEIDPYSAPKKLYAELEKTSKPYDKQSGKTNAAKHKAQGKAEVQGMYPNLKLDDLRFDQYTKESELYEKYGNIELTDIKEWSEKPETIEKYKDRFGLEWRVKLDEAVSKMIEKVSPIHEKIAGLVKKAEKSGMPYSILKQVYNRGMAAWRTGHRPGTTPQQWAMARVNSFVTKSSGTWGGADKDLAAKVK
jgi:nicotinic acid mononucleotide adenylyltransferase